ncbi:flippase activity-associated protein Agl23 [Halovenus rubra]|uniref:Flippase activity-associated protein Agl23 n=2 Tax=Halovenus rubra TaxID=869890 RepID=A0ABD5X716_9EURY|nr:flippase activity-associated protein Agl23 [Halovenus rubra]
MSGRPADDENDGEGLNGETHASQNEDEMPLSPDRSAETADEDSSKNLSESGKKALFDRYESLTLFRVVGAITLLAIVLRLVALGARAAHWDEARVAYWSYFYTDTGASAYHYEEHGPLAQLAAARMFEFFGVNDFTARLPVAVVGGVLPLSATLYRKHLRRTETVALAVLLALNPVLLYYSRFMRSDVLVAAFMFTAFGLLVRFYDTRKVRYLLVAGVVFGLGFGSKENAIIYLLTWGGALGVLADQYLHRPASETTGLDHVTERFGTYWNSLKAAAYRIDYAIAGFLSFVATLVVVFAPRGQGKERRFNPTTDADPVTLKDAVGSPGQVPTLVDETLNEAYSGYIEWFAQSEGTTLDTYISFLGDYVTILIEYAPLMTAFALLGIIFERYASEHSRALIMFMSYCGVASLVGYPLGSHIQGDSGWLSVHVIIPLLVPASVGVAWTYDRIRELVAKRSVNPVVVVAVLVLLVGVWGWAIPAQAVYLNDTADDNELVQYAQPASDLGPLIESMEEVAAENQGTDVMLYYGEKNQSYEDGEALVHRNISRSFAGDWQVEPTCSVWGESQPLNWYFSVTGSQADCERSPTQLASSVTDGDIPIVITVPGDSTVPENAFDDSYTKQSYYLRNVGEEVVVYTQQSTDQS